jgi:hypothetical protein
MLENSLIILSIFAFVFLWRFIGKYPDLPAKILHRLRHRAEAMNYELLDVLPVYSAETLAGKEAEFVDQKPYDKRKMVYGIRAILSICFLIIVYVFWKN